MTNSPARAYRQAIVDLVKSFESELTNDQEARFTIFLAGREIPLGLSRISSNDEGLIIFCGLDLDGNIIDVGMHYTMVSYTLEAVPKKDPMRFGFGVSPEEK